MAILIKGHNAIFIHVPKTGGVFIENVIRSLGKDQWIAYRHSPINMIGKILYQPNLFKFLFVREPAEWYRSYWQMKMNGKTFSERWYLCEQNSVLFHPTWEIDPFCGSDNLDEFVLNCSKLGGFLNRLYKQFIGEGRMKVDYIGDQATLIEDLHAIFNHIKLPHNIEGISKRPRLNFVAKRVEMKPETRKLINEVEGYYYEIKKGFQ